MCERRKRESMDGGNESANRGNEAGKGNEKVRMEEMRDKKGKIKSANGGNERQKREIKKCEWGK